MTAPTTAHELPFVDEIMGTTETDPRDFVKLTLSILGVLSAIALVGWQLVRHRSQQNGSAHKAPRALQLMATLPLAPKRQILLIRVRDTEMAVASTEHGIALLGDVTTSNRTAIGTSPRIAASLSPLQIDGVTQESLLETEVTTTTRQKQGDATLRNQPETKSEILRKALQTIEDRRRPEVQKKQSKSEEQANFSRSTLPPGNEATRFKKLFSNSYKQTNASTDPALESERGSFSTPNGNQGHGDSYSDKQTENVAQLIREKLKHMRTIS
jgi:flagellar biogenesis protein FliO